MNCVQSFAALNDRKVGYFKFHARVFASVRALCVCEQVSACSASGNRGSSRRSGVSYVLPIAISRGQI